MAARTASLELVSEVGQDQIYRPKARRLNRKRESHESGFVKHDDGDRAEVQWGSGTHVGTKTGVWTAIGSNSRRSRTPAQVRYERSTTSGSLPSLDLSEVEADAARDDLDLDLDLRLFSHQDYTGRRAPTYSSRRNSHSPYHHITSVIESDEMEVEPLNHKSQRKKSQQEKSGEMATQEAEGAVLDAYSRFLWAAVVKGNLAAVRGVYKEKKVLYIDHHGNTALHLAARIGQVNIIKWLLRYSGVRATIRNSRGETCTHVAAKHAQVSCLRHILFGASSRPLVLASERDRQGLTPIHLAAIVGNWSVVRWLVNTFGSPVGISRNALGQTPLHFSAAKGCVKSTEALCRLGDEIINSRDNVGCTPLYYAAQEGQVLTLRHLVDVVGAKIDIGTKDGLTPLHAACQTGRVDIVHFLLQRGDSKTDLCHQTKDGATVFHMASANGRADTLALLLRCKASERGLRMRDCKGSNPAHDAAENGHLECLKLLYAAGLDMHQPDEDGETPYSLASRSSNEDCVVYSKVLQHRPLEMTPSSDFSESPQSDVNSAFFNTDLTKEQLLVLMDSEIIKRKKINREREKESSNLQKETRRLFRKITSKFEEDRQSPDNQRRPSLILKKDFILRPMADKKKNTDLGGNVAYKQPNRPAAVNMPLGSQSLLLQKVQNESDILEGEIPSVSSKAHTWNELSFLKFNMVPSGTTRSLRALAAKIKQDTIVDDDQIESLLNISKTLSLTDLRDPEMPRLHANSTDVVETATVTKEPNQEPMSAQHEAMTQTYADPRDIYKGTDGVVKSKVDYLRTASTQTIPPASTDTSESNVYVIESPVPPKRAPKLKHLSEYRPLKDKVTLEFESIPETESSNSCFEKRAKMSEENENPTDYFGKDSDHEAKNEMSETGIISRQLIFPVDTKSKIADNCENKNLEKAVAQLPDSPISLQNTTKESVAVMRRAKGQKRQIHPKIDILRTILSESGIITPYEDHQCCQFPQSSRPETPDHDPNQDNKVIEGIDESLNESSAVLPSSPYSHPPPPLPPPPPPPPIPPSLSFLKPTNPLQMTSQRLTSQSGSIDSKSNSTPSSGATSGYITPDMRTPPLISSPGVANRQFSYLAGGARQGHHGFRNEQSSGGVERPRVKNSGNENTKEPQYWHRGLKLSDPYTQQINVPPKKKGSAWNVNLRRVPPRKESSNQMSELERYFKILEKRRWGYDNFKEDAKT